MADNSPNFHPLKSFDHPILSHSAAAREALEEDATPKPHVDQGNSASLGVRPGKATGLPSPGHFQDSKDTGDIPADYFDVPVEKPTARRRHSADLRPDVASPLIPEIPSQ